MPFLRRVFIDRDVHFGKYLGEQVKGRSLKNQKRLIGVPYVAHLIVQNLSFNMNLISSPYRVPRPSYPIRDKFGRSGKQSFTEKGKIVDRHMYVLQYLVKIFWYKLSNQV